MVVRDLPVIWNIIFRPFLKIGLTFANLEALGNLFKNIERLQISVTGLERKEAPSFKNVPGSLPMPATFVVSISFKALSIYSFSAGGKSNLLFSPNWLYY